MCFEANPQQCLLFKRLARAGISQEFVSEGFERPRFITPLMKDQIHDSETSLAKYAAHLVCASDDIAPCVEVAA